MNLATLRTFASLFCSDPNQTRYTVAQYNSALNLAQQQFALDSKALFKDTTITVVAATSSYALPTDFMFEKTGQITLANKALTPISRARLNAIGKDWTLDTGTPLYYNIDPEEARKTLLLYPQPTSSDAGSSVVMTYFPLPADMSSDTSIPLNSSLLLVQFHIGIACYGAWLISGNEESSAEMVSKRADLMKQYNDSVNMAVDKFKNTVSEGLQMLGGRYWPGS